MDYVRDVLYDEFEPIDVEEQFDNYLDSMYDFKDVGYPFSYYSPAKVLKKMDEVNYRTMRNDYINEQNYVYDYDEYWNKDDFEKAEEIAKEVEEDMED